MDVKEFKKLKSNRMVEEYTKLLQKKGELEEENSLLIAQAIAEEKTDIEEIKPDVKAQDMDEFELSSHMSRKTSIKTF